MFKLIDVGEGPNKRTQLWVTETDSHGTERLRQPEFFFRGIAGHVQDTWGYAINGWREASRIANYWRRYFQIDEVPYNFHGTEPHGQRENNDLPENPAGDAPVEDDADDASNLEVDPVPSVPRQISRLAHIL